MDLLNNLSQQPPWVQAAAEEAWNKAQKIIAASEGAKKYEKYIQHPVQFMEDVLEDQFTDDIVKVIESVRDNPVTIARSSNGVGKTHAAARVAIWFYSVYADAKVYMTAAPPFENLKKLLWGQIATIARKKPTLFTGHIIKALEIKRHDESFITGVAIPLQGDSATRQAKFSGKHAPHMLFILDEGDAIPEEVYKGIESCASGGHVRILIMFNPRDKSGPVYQKEVHAQANVVEISAFRHPNVITGKDIIPGAVSREVTVRRINEWTRELMVGEKSEDDPECFEVPDFLVGETAQALDGHWYPPLRAGFRKVTESAFWYMVLGKYPAQSEQQLISETWIMDARKRYDDYVAVNGLTPPAGAKLRLGIDIAEYGGDYNTAVRRYDDFVPPVDFWAGMDVDESADEAYRLHLKYGADITLVDGTGIGSGVAPKMARKGRANRLDVRAAVIKVAEKPSPLIKTDLGEFTLLRDQIWWCVREWLKKKGGNAMLPPDEMLLEELRIVTYEVKSGKIRVMDKKAMRDRLKRSPDRSDGLALTFAPMERAHFTHLTE